MALDKLQALRCFPEVDRRIRAGDNPKDIAAYMQEEQGEYADVGRDSLIRQLYRYKKLLPANQLSIPEAKYLHDKLQEFAGEVNEVDMLQKLFYVQMERIFQFRETEKLTRFPIKAMYKEIEQGKDILVKLGELKIKLGYYEGAATERLSISGNPVERKIQELPSESRERLGAAVRDAFARMLEAGSGEETEGVIVDAEIVVEEPEKSAP